MIDIKKLREYFKKNGKRYQLIQNEQDCAIYAVMNIRGEVESFDVFRVKIFKFKEGFKEIYPQLSDYGRTAWNYKGLEDAQKKFIYLINNRGYYDKF